MDKSNEVFKEYLHASSRWWRSGRSSRARTCPRRHCEAGPRDAKVLEAHKATAKEVTMLRAQKAKLEMLCRTLQGERSQLHAKLGVGASSDDGTDGSGSGEGGGGVGTASWQAR